MALEMKTECERCGQTLDHDSEAWICSYECTFCSPCSAEMHNFCPNCGGNLQRRPLRSPETV
ncbi:MAG: DUF1272 domain-containing protein [Gammaproteobacteria bacterium]|nr:DUF1272 domain-containing protein [Gammaproteobacteria bacterium]